MGYSVPMTQTPFKQYVTMVRAIGPGFHPDTRGSDYTSLPAGYTPQQVDQITLAAHRSGLDIYLVALDVLEGGSGHGPSLSQILAEDGQQ